MCSACVFFFVVVIFLGFRDRCFRLGYILTDLIIYISFSVINRDILLCRRHKRLVPIPLNTSKEGC